ncbi:hypothetical protein ANN_20012 [Periplaneta americana]|uniref:Uncharacterized protein n=1 Tax=Periplaneta americana TaxID=6978 RepID=A0ABQ8SCI0_PERAM|nr:hypothetical protein ANN_20012 [Periplaneta americana]
MAVLCEGGNEPPGSLKATSRIRYEITSGNIGGAFAVKNMTGAIYVAGALDYETRKRRIPNLTGPVDNNDVTLQRNRNKTAGRIDGCHGDLHDVIRLLIPALYKNQSDSLMAADGDCHHLCKLMALVRHRWSISVAIGEIRNTVMPSDCSALRFGIRSSAPPKCVDLLYRFLKRSVVLIKIYYPPLHKSVKHGGGKTHEERKKACPLV